MDCVKVNILAVRSSSRFVRCYCWGKLDKVYKRSLYYLLQYTWIYKDFKILTTTTKVTQMLCVLWKGMKASSGTGELQLGLSVRDSPKLLGNHIQSWYPQTLWVMSSSVPLHRLPPRCIMQVDYPQFSSQTNVSELYPLQRGSGHCSVSHQPHTRGCVGPLLCTT